jgi:hypothetical protein
VFRTTQQSFIPIAEARGIQIESEIIKDKKEVDQNIIDILMVML